MILNSLVSIIIPVYNRSNFLNECLISVYKQTYRPIEVIIVDDGSTDNSVNVAHDFQSNYSSSQFLITILNQKNAGAPVARNHGFRKSAGEYIQFLDSDDLLLPKKIENQLQYFSKNISGVYSKAQFFSKTPKEPLEKFWGKPLTNTSKDLFEFNWQTMCALYKREAVLNDCFWDENLTIYQDWDYCIRHIVKNKNFYFLDEVSSFYRFHNFERIGSQLSKKKIQGIFNSTKSIFTFLKKQKKITLYLKVRFLKRFLYCFVKLKKFDDKKFMYQCLSVLKEVVFA